MPTLDELQRATTPIAITRGKVKFRLDAALEKLAVSDPAKTTEGTTYPALRRAYADLAFRRAMASQRTDAVLQELASLANVPAFRAKLESTRPVVVPHRTSRCKTLPQDPITDDELAEAYAVETARLERELDAINESISGNAETGAPGLDAELRLNVATRVAYLVGGSDITTAEGQPALCGLVDKTPEQLAADALVFNSFSKVLLDHVIKVVEEAVYGPLVTPGSSAN